MDRTRSGMIPVCGFLSPAEKELQTRLRSESRARWVKMVPSGLPLRFDPSAEDSRHLAAGRLLILYTLPGSAPVPAGLPLEDAVVVEAEYRHPVLSDCAHYVPGKRWLLHQAIAGYSLFTGEQPSVEEMLRAL